MTVQCAPHDPGQTISSNRVLDPMSAPASSAAVFSLLRTWASPDLLEMMALMSRERAGLRFWISNKLPSDADAAGPGSQF